MHLLVLRTIDIRLMHNQVIRSRWLTGWMKDFRRQRVLPRRRLHSTLQISLSSAQAMKLAVHEYSIVHYHAHPTKSSIYIRERQGTPQGQTSNSIHCNIPWIHGGTNHGRCCNPNHARLVYHYWEGPQLQVVLAQSCSRRLKATSPLHLPLKVMYHLGLALQWRDLDGTLHHPQLRQGLLDTLWHQWHLRHLLLPLPALELLLMRLHLPHRHNSDPVDAVVLLHLQLDL
jgi:hypothetical protein